MQQLFRFLMLGIAGLGFSALFLCPSHATESKFNTWVEEIKFGGDMRLRHEYFDKDTPGQADRSRQRFRLRFGWEFKLPANLMAYAKLASGTGEQVSTNQSFDNLSSQKALWIDLAYLKWKPLRFLTLQGGRMANPIWRKYSSDVVWDGDYNPEGFSESVSYLFGMVDLSFTALQMVLDEDSGNNVGTNSAGQQADQWMLGHQVTAETKLPFEKRLKVGYANYYWKNENWGNFGQNATNEGNRRNSSTLAFNGGALQNAFNVDEFTGELKGWILNLPLSFQGTYVVNRGAKTGTQTVPGGNTSTNTVTVSFTPEEDYGYQWGLILGEAKSKGTWEVAYFNKQVRTDATVADIADSDFGDGGTNRKGHIVWVGYAPQDWMLLQIKHFDTEVINPALSPGRDDINRTQFDLSVKF